ncbi:MAG: response regulator transcription factor [Blastocatellia bacterium]
MPPKSPRILIIEDDADTREMLRFMLTAEAYEVVTAEGVADGLTIALQRGLDLIMIDNWLAEGSGVMLCRYIRVFDQTTPILFHSAAAYQRDIQEALDAGAQDYITKPADPEHILLTIRELISGNESSNPNGTT